MQFEIAYSFLPFDLAWDGIERHEMYQSKKESQFELMHLKSASYAKKWE